MLKIFWDLRDFIIVVAHRWGIIATGGIIVALIGVFEHWSGRSITGWPFWLAIATSVFSAVFLVWRDERNSAFNVKGQLNEISKLKFVIDSPEAEISIGQCGAGPQGRIFCVSTQIKVQFENHSNQSRTVRDVSVALYEERDSGLEKEITTVRRPLIAHLASDVKMLDFSNGILVEGGNISPHYLFLITIELPVGFETQLDTTCFLRITMSATGQPPTHVDGEVDWDKAFSGGSPLSLKDTSFILNQLLWPLPQPDNSFNRSAG